MLVSQTMAEVWQSLRLQRHVMNYVVVGRYAIFKYVMYRCIIIKIISRLVCIVVSISVVCMF